MDKNMKLHGANNVNSIISLVLPEENRINQVCQNNFGFKFTKLNGSQIVLYIRLFVFECAGLIKKLWILMKIYGLKVYGTQRSDKTSKSDSYTHSLLPDTQSIAIGQGRHMRFVLLGLKVIGHANDGLGTLEFWHLVLFLDQ